MNEKFNFHTSFGIFTPKLWYATLFRTAPSTASKDEEDELEFLEFECFTNETEEVFSDLIPLGIYQGVEDTESDLDGEGAALEDYDEAGNSNDDIEIEIVDDEEEEEEEEGIELDQYTPLEQGENHEEEDDMEMEEQQVSMIQFLNERLNDAAGTDSFLSALDNSFSSS